MSMKALSVNTQRLVIVEGDHHNGQDNMNWENRIACDVQTNSNDRNASIARVVNRTLK